MNTHTLKLIPLLLASPLCLHAQTMEQAATEQCSVYFEKAKSRYNEEQFLPCASLTRTKNEWSCMIEKRINDGWSYTDASTTCFDNDQPFLKYILKKNPDFSNQTKQRKPSLWCHAAISAIKKHFPESEQNQYVENLCDLTTRTSAEWACALALGEQGNSYNFAVGQCFKKYRYRHHSA